MRELIGAAITRPKTRLLLVAAWLLVSLAWLFCSDFILSEAHYAGMLTPFDSFIYMAWRRAIFLTATGTLIYLLLGRQRLGGIDGSEQLKELSDTLTIGAALAAPSGVLRYANPAFFRFFDVTQAVIGQTSIEDLLRGRVEGMRGGFLPAAGKAEFTIRKQMTDGRELELLVAVMAGVGVLDGYIVTVTDVTELRRITRRDALYGQSLNTMPLATMICDPVRPGFPLVYVNQAFEQLSGYAADEVIGNSCTFLQDTDKNQDALAAVRKAFGEQKPVAVTLRNYHKSGSIFWNELQLSPLLNASGQAVQYLGVARDVTKAREALQSLEREVYYDNLTSLYNRRGFTKGVTDLLQQPDVDYLLLVKIDIHNFHEFNTALGWDAGDALLVEVADRLSRMLPGRCMGRAASNEFAVAEPIEAGDAESIVASIRHGLEGRYILPGTTCEPLFAIGFTAGPRSLGTRKFMQQASVALNEARHSVFGETRRFDRETENTISERRRLTSELQEAVQNGDFLVHYQPKVDLPTGRIVGAEALVRWRHPLFGLQPPARFVPLAEETGLIVDIGDLALTEALAFAASINAGRLEPIPIGVNVSYAQFRRLDLVKTVERALLRSGADPSWLQLELTESIYIAASSETLAVLERLRDLGVGLVIDDFGTGYSSLRYLARFPVNEIKIDRCFVTGLKDATVNQAVVEAILSMGQAKGAAVTAEGIETEEERQLLLGMGCRIGQGYLFSYPVSEDELRGMLDSGLRLPVVKPVRPSIVSAIS
jgi:PAS domain S-box-containing protein/diguanylate cyclase (GGDEF)-like protein